MIRTIGCLSVLLPAVFLFGAHAVAAPSTVANEPIVGEQHFGHLFARKVFIRGGCPYNLDKECDRLPNGRLVHCRCVS